MLKITAALLALILTGVTGQPAARLLDIYWIDVEGGASTLIVTAQGQSLLMDSGYEGLNDRDPGRIEKVAREEAGIRRLDYMVTSHFHADHVGGLASVASRFTVAAFADHGESVEQDTAAGHALFLEYLAVAGRHRRVVKPGDKLALKGIDVTIVAANGQVLKTPLAKGTANPSCATFETRPDDAGENGRSVGYLLRAGAFEFLDLGDLSWNFQKQLVCPMNLLGPVDIAQAPHHAVRDDVLPQLMSAITPTAVVINNGPVKGGGPVAIDAVLKSPGLESLWSLHRVIANDAAHNAPEPQTANVGVTENCPGAWIRARLSSDGTYTITNSRNSFSKTYRVK